MFNLLMTSLDDYWTETNETSMGWDRVFEYTDPELRQLYTPRSQKAIDGLLGMPALFTYEYSNRLPSDDSDLPTPSRIGRIVQITPSDKKIDIKFEIDLGVEPISAREIARIADQLYIQKSENYRSHWAVKPVDLIELLKKEGIYKTVTAAKVEDELRNIADDIVMPGDEQDKVFIVHGHDSAALHRVARYLGKMKLRELVLNEQANAGHTVMSKFMELSDGVKFAVVILSADDVGGAKGGSQAYRPRQNVVFELGYFLGKLGRQRVAVLKSGDLELPSDFAGVVTIDYDASGAWLLPLVKELKAAGLRFDLNGIL
ncbi:nucleotide-binding protein [Neorhizobium galegae]|uniref:TIR domain-containing protein n=1 Tax=Neorhizobium galegae TaxID=399 RepID=UPI002107DF9C|nr:nucleotide-binding protein [Neorhizobium galegae]MCQ1764715.1 nucleotide-binding protein [Neorhizobium galegae]MCQ1849286.1 nucleotide-binding protein [Neorhizobium galegae]